MKLHKLAVASALVCTAAGVLLPHELGSLYPYANVAFTAGIVAVVLLAWRDPNRDERVGTYLGSVVALSVAYRVRILAFAASLFGIDADSYAIQIAKVIDTGRTSAIAFEFYRKAPYHLLEGAITGIVTGAPPLVWSSVYALIVGLGAPLFAAAVVSRLRPGATATMVFAAGGVSVVGFLLWYSLAPIAQTSGTVFLLFAVFAGLVFVIETRPEWLLLSFLFGLGTVYTHKLTGIALAVGTLGTLVLVSVHPTTRDTDVPRATLLLTAVMAALVLFQQFYLTDFGSIVVFQISQTLFSTSTQTSMAGPAGPPTAATDPYTTAHRAYRLSYLFVLAALGGLGWFGWFWTTVRSRRRADVVLLGMVASLAALVVLLYPTGVNPIRNILLSEPFLIVVVAVGVFWQLVERSGTRSTVGVLVSVAVVGLVVSAGLSPIASPDYEPVGQQYLTETETHAKLWGTAYGDGRISTDQYYALTTPPSRISYIADHGRDASPWFAASTDVYLNRRFATARPAMVAHRSCITTLRSGHGVWQLTYDASELLRASYDGVYDNGCVAYYAAPGTAGAPNGSR